jgi:hypothetical protein
VLEHSRQKETGIIRRNWTRHVAGSKKGLVVVAVSMPKLMGFFHHGVAEI